MKPRIENCGEPLTDQKLATVEEKLKVAFPRSYRAFLLESNGGTPVPEYWQQRHALDCFHRVGGSNDGYNLLAEAKSMRDDIPPEMIPIATSASGDVICLVVDGPKTDQVYLWDHENAFDDDDDDEEEDVPEVEDEDYDDEEIAAADAEHNKALAEKAMQVLLKDGYSEKEAKNLVESMMSDDDDDDDEDNEEDDEEPDDWPGYPMMGLLADSFEEFINGFDEDTADAE